MAKAKTNTRTKRTAAKASKPVELDSVYFLKLVMYLLVGTQWLWLETSSGSQLPIPIGLIIGLLFAMHDHFKIDRKIEFAVLLLAMLFGYLAHIGLFIGS